MDIRKRSFSSIFLSVCSGTDVFASVIRLSWFKSVAHLFLLSVIGALFLSTARSYNLSAEILYVCGFLQERFGGAIVGNALIQPEKSPDIARSYILGKGRIDYSPSKEELAKTCAAVTADKSSTYGFIWNPSGIVGWQRLDEAQLIVHRALFSKHLSRTPLSAWSGDKFFDIIQENGLQGFVDKSLLPATPPLLFWMWVPIIDSAPLPMLLVPLGVKTDFDKMFGSVFIYLSLRLFVGFIFQLFFNSFFYALLFAFVFSAMGRMGYQSLRFTSFLTLAVYASFPALVAATLFSAARLEWLDYHSVFLPVFVVYLMFVMRRLRDLADTEKGSSSTDFD